MDARQLIIEPVVSEKSYALMADGKYTFRVDERAHKTQIARAVEEIFEVRVKAVRTAKVPRSRSGAGCTAAAPARGRRRSCNWRPGSGSSCSRAPRWPNDERASDEQLIHADSKDKANQPRAALRDLPASRRAEHGAASQAADQGKSKSGGRNAHGRITSRHRGGGAKRRYRQIDFKRRKDGVPARVATIEYDPNRTCYIALVQYADGEKRYILAPQGLQPGDPVESGERADIRPGNALPLRSIPTGTDRAQRRAGSGPGWRLGRAAGSGIQVAAKEGQRVTLRLPSSEMRMVHADCRATVGVLSTPSTRTSSWARRAAPATRAAARRLAEWR